jgi:hypothetical protein
MVRCLNEEETAAVSMSVIGNYSALAMTILSGYVNSILLSRLSLRVDYALGWDPLIRNTLRLKTGSNVSGL